MSQWLSQEETLESKSFLHHSPKGERIRVVKHSFCNDSMMQKWQLQHTHQGREDKAHFKSRKKSVCNQCRKNTLTDAQAQSLCKIRNVKRAFFQINKTRTAFFLLYKKELRKKAGLTKKHWKDGMVFHSN